MARLRFFLMCLMMLALPLQGFAAASMLFCGTAAVGPAEPAGEHRHAHLAGAGHPSAEHPGPGQQHAQVQADQASAGAHDGGHAAQDSHKCGVCASCGQAVAITQSTMLATPSPAPQAALTEQQVPVLSRPALVPDKPPRA